MLPMGIGSSLCSENKTTNDIVSGYRTQSQPGGKTQFEVFTPAFVLFLFRRLYNFVAVHIVNRFKGGYRVRAVGDLSRPQRDRTIK